MSEKNWKLAEYNLGTDPFNRDTDYDGISDYDEFKMGTDPLFRDSDYDGLVAVSMDGDFYFPMYDRNGNIIAYINEQGSPVAQYQYDAFGNTVELSGDLAPSFTMRFSTKYCDDI